LKMDSGKELVCVMRMSLIDHWSQSAKYVSLWVYFLVHMHNFSWVFAMHILLSSPTSFNASFLWLFPIAIILLYFCGMALSQS